MARARQPARKITDRATNILKADYSRLVGTDYLQVGINPSHITCGTSLSGVSFKVSRSVCDLGSILVRY